MSNWVPSTASTRRSPSGANLSASRPVVAATLTSGTRAMIPAKPSAPSPATSHIVARQPDTPPSQVPSGTPRADDTLIPPRTSASARPRRSGPASAVATPEAVGVNMAAPAAEITRAARTSG